MLDTLGRAQGCIDHNDYRAVLQESSALSWDALTCCRQLDGTAADAECEAAAGKYWRSCRSSVTV